MADRTDSDSPVAHPTTQAEQPELEGELHSDEVRRLHGDLKMAQEALIQSRQDHKAAVQELRAANEELQSVNEEYRSTSEELETSQEELQSMNEELQTVNAELKSKLDSISQAHSDLQNLTAATEIGTLFLDTELRIKMFTAPVAELFNITEQDVGRAFTHFTHRLHYESFESDVRSLMRNLSQRECEVRSVDGRWFMLRLRPYRSVENRIEGVVASFIDITDRITAEQALAQSERRLRALVNASSQVLYVMNPDWTDVRELSPISPLFQVREIGSDWLEHYVHPDDRARVRQAIDQAIRTKSTFELEHRAERDDGRIGWTFSRAVPILDAAGDVIEWFGAASDVSPAKRADERNATLLSELQHRVRNMLTMIVSIAKRTAERSVTVDQYRDRLLGRLSALSRTQTLLMRTEGVDLRTMVQDELNAIECDAAQGTLEGPTVVLPPKTTEVLLLAIHELATNAAKYGALSVTGGRVQVSWTARREDGQTWVRVEWVESGVQGVARPSRNGFGSELITRRVPYELSGNATLEFLSGGARCVIEFPLSQAPSELQSILPENSDGE